MCGLFTMNEEKQLCYLADHSVLFYSPIPSRDYMEACEPIQAYCVQCGIPVARSRTTFICGNCGRLTNAHFGRVENDSV